MKVLLNYNFLMKIILKNREKDRESKEKRFGKHVCGGKQIGNKLSIQVFGLKKKEVET